MALEDQQCPWSPAAPRNLLWGAGRGDLLRAGLESHSRRLGLGHCREGPASAPGVGGGGRCTLEASWPPAIFNDLEV